ncbi:MULTISPECIES: hypothetical protein [Bradyrhizobium]|uniref:Uncharacterized protein n=1 Tax=Bradyrhizobium septentrionale TaxID=1404411 RepID=A0ABZ2PC59_9BRAD
MTQYAHRITVVPRGLIWLASTGLTAIAAPAKLAPPAGAAYCTIQAVGGIAYYTLGGSAPSPAAYDGSIGDGATMAMQGPDPIGRLRLIGAQMCVNFYR